jgi:two-component system NtrC family sensor kinase
MDNVMERESSAPTASPPPQWRRRHVSLQMQFQIALGVLFLAFCGLSAFQIYAHEKGLIEQNALNKSHLVMAAVESTRNYVQEVLRPKMYDFAGPETFVLEAMSTSYITRAVMERFNENLPEYRYRRVAVNARNPLSTPSPTEFELIEFFRQNPDQDRWQGIRPTGADTGFIHARPVYMEASCLYCHGEPADAPAKLLELYGSRRGFGYREGDLAGVMAVSIPVNVALKQIRSQALSVFWVSLMMLTCLYVLISYLFNRMVVRHLAGVLGIFREGLVETRDQERFQHETNMVEIGELTEAAQDMTDHLRQTREALERHAGELEARVAERTQDLEESRARLHAKVTTRNRELQTLNHITELITRSFRLKDILPQVLEKALQLIPAQGAGIYLLDQATPQLLLLQCRRNADKLDTVITAEPPRTPDRSPQSLAQAMWGATQGHTNVFACQRNQNCLNIPLNCRERVLGVMTFVGVDFDETTAEQQALLMSIGHQIGITVESLQNVAALVQHKELLQSVFDGIPDIMVLLDRDLVIRMVNRAYLKRHGLALEDVLDRPCAMADASGDCPLAGTQLQQAIATRQQTKEEVRTANGEIFLVYYYPILDEAGEVWGILRYAKDITLENQVEQRIQQTEKMAALGQLAAGVAHEINNPMSIILCYTDLLQRQLGKKAQAASDVETIEKQARNCQKIVSDLLNFARSRMAAPRPTDINEALQEVVGMLHQQFRKRGTEIDQTLAAALPAIPVDADKMKQVFLNLLMNAHQALEGARGRIRVATAFDPGRNTVEISIADSGPGIPPAIVDKIFDPFFSTKQSGEGTGLGLSVSYGIVTDHGGTIEVGTTADDMTEFIVRLPAVPRQGDEP